MKDLYKIALYILILWPSIYATLVCIKSARSDAIKASWIMAFFLIPVILPAIYIVAGTKSTGPDFIDREAARQKDRIYY